MQSGHDDHCQWDGANACRQTAAGVSEIELQLRFTTLSSSERCEHKARQAVALKALISGELSTMPEHFDTSISVCSLQTAHLGAFREDEGHRLAPVPLPGKQPVPELEVDGGLSVPQLLHPPDGLSLGLCSAQAIQLQA